MMRANLRQGLTSPTYLLVWVLLVTISSLDPYVKAAQECVVEADGSENCSEVGNDEIEECVDALPGDKCEMLVSYEGCINDFSNLRKQCAATCLLCGDTLTEEELLHGNGEPFYLDRIFSEDPQRVEGDYRKDTYRRLLDVEQYMYNTIYVEEEFTSIKEDCQMKSELCTFWAMTGECEKNPTYMNVHCAPACFTCHMLDFKSRCPYDAEAPTFLQEPGDLDKLFERIVTDPELAVFQPRAIVRPNATGESEDEGPWIVVLDNFLSEDECDVLIRLGGELGYERSMDVGEKLFDGSYGSVESKDRTSSNAWCVDKCWEDDVNTRVHDRLEKLTGIDRMNYEYLQLLSYEEGEFYGQHHDFIDYQVNRPQGVRTLTVFLYLNDVPKGGGTHFSVVDKTVFPKRGRAVIWPSVLNEDPNVKDPRTDHEALPVEEGVKYGANAWIHQRDFKTPWKSACH